VFQTEKQLKEFGDKIPAEKKTAIETAMNALKAAHAAKDMPAIAREMETLNNAWSAASQDMYQGGDQPPQGDAGQGNANANTNANASAEATDVDFEEVKS
jgi:molecular chaperone DnaK